MTGEIAVRRNVFDQLLLSRAAEVGATIREGAVVVNVAREERSADTSSGRSSRLFVWEIETCAETFHARVLIAADGRNSTVARLLNLLPAADRDRVGLQTHFPLPLNASGRVVMRFLPRGYCGLADVGNGEANLCLVSWPANLGEVKRWASEHFGLGENQTWRSIAPLSRKAVHPAHDGLLLVGDAARVVEPFTGEGIFYALASGELAARHVIAGDLPSYAATHARLYRGRLWINQLARFACLHPRIASAFLRLARWKPALLGLLTRKVVAAPQDISAATN